MLWHTSSEYNRQIYIVIEGCLRVYFEEQLPNREADHPCSKDGSLNFRKVLQAD